MHKVSKSVPQGWELRPLTPLSDVPVIAGFSISTAYSLANSGTLEFAKLGGRTYVRTTSLIAYISTARPYLPDSGRVAVANRARKRAADDAWRA